MKPLISKTYSAIIYNKNYKQSDYTIVKQLECDKMAIYNILKCLHKTDSFTSKKKRTGCLPLLNTSAQQELKVFV